VFPVPLKKATDLIEFAVLSSRRIWSFGCLFIGFYVGVWNVSQYVGQLARWLVQSLDLLAHWLVGSLVDQFVSRFDRLFRSVIWSVGSLWSVGCLVVLSLCLLVGWLFDQFVGWLVGWLVCWPGWSDVRSLSWSVVLIVWLVGSFWLIGRLVV